MDRYCFCYGAGHARRFARAVRKGKPDRLTETAQFTQVWKEENGQWRLARVRSYDHQLAGQTGADK